MSTQTELSLKIAGPEVTQEEIEAVCLFLKGRGWVFSRDLFAALNVDDRHVRVVAEHSQGRIISGQKGYRLFDRTTPIGEADHAASWLEAQGRKMIKRGAEIRRRIHRLARDPDPAGEKGQNLLSVSV